jgi:protein disulfide-isomerase-like protein
MVSSRRQSITLLLLAFCVAVCFLQLRQCCAEKEEGLEFSDHRSFGEEEEEEVEDFDDDSYKGYDSEEFDESAFDFSTFGEAVDEKDVVVLGAANFTAFVKANKYVLVEFYAPWCGHCKSLLPEWAKAATILKGEVPLVKVDATKHGDLAREYGVEGYPSLFFFVEGAHRPYTGDRTRLDSSSSPPTWFPDTSRDSRNLHLSHVDRCLFPFYNM